MTERKLAAVKGVEYGERQEELMEACGWAMIGVLRGEEGAEERMFALDAELCPRGQLRVVDAAPGGDAATPEAEQGG